MVTSLIPENRRKALPHTAHQGRQVAVCAMILSFQRNVQISAHTRKISWWSRSSSSSNINPTYSWMDILQTRKAFCHFKKKICFGIDVALVGMKYCRSLLAQLNERVPAIPGSRKENLVNYVRVSLIQFLLIWLHFFLQEEITVFLLYFCHWPVTPDQRSSWSGRWLWLHQMRLFPCSSVTFLEFCLHLLACFLSVLLTHSTQTPSGLVLSRLSSMSPLCKYEPFLSLVDDFVQFFKMFFKMP